MGSRALPPPPQTMNYRGNNPALGGGGRPRGPSIRSRTLCPSSVGTLPRGGVSWLHILPVHQAQPCHIPAGCHGDWAALQLWSSYQGAGPSWWLSLNASPALRWVGQEHQGRDGGAQDQEVGEQAFLGLNTGWGDSSGRGCLPAPFSACERQSPHLFMTFAHSAPPSSQRTCY